MILWNERPFSIPRTTWRRRGRWHSWNGATKLLIPLWPNLTRSYPSWEMIPVSSWFTLITLISRQSSLSTSTWTSTWPLSRSHVRNGLQLKADRCWTIRSSRVWLKKSLRNWHRWVIERRNRCLMKNLSCSQLTDITSEITLIWPKEHPEFSSYPTKATSMASEINQHLLRRSNTGLWDARKPLRVSTDFEKCGIWGSRTIKG